MSDLAEELRVMTIGRASDLAQAMQRAGDLVILITGCWDILHVGHIRLVEFASEYGEVFVGANSDESIKALKGDSRPVNNLGNRMRVMAALRYVRAVFPIHDKRVSNAIATLYPNYWVKGADYTMETLDRDEVAAANSCGAKILFAPIVQGVSTTKIIERLKA